VGFLPVHRHPLVRLSVLTTEINRHNCTGGTENAGLENARLEFAAPECKGGKCRTGLCETRKSMKQRRYIRHIAPLLIGYHTLSPIGCIACLLCVAEPEEGPPHPPVGGGDSRCVGEPFWAPQNAKNLSVAGAPPRTPLRELTALPHTF